MVSALCFRSHHGVLRWMCASFTATIGDFAGDIPKVYTNRYCRYVVNNLIGSPLKKINITESRFRHIRTPVCTHLAHSHCTRMPMNMIMMMMSHHPHPTRTHRRTEKGSRDDEYKFDTACLWYGGRTRFGWFFGMLFLVASVVPFRFFGPPAAQPSPTSEASKYLLIFRQMTAHIIMDGFWRFGVVFCSCFFCFFTVH